MPCRGTNFGLGRLERDLPDFATVHAVPRRPYGLVSSLNQSYLTLRNDYNLHDYGTDGIPGWVRGIGPCILHCAYPRKTLPTLMSTRERPLGVWWYMVQKILPFPEQSQRDAPILMVPSQLVTETTSEVLMWHMWGEEDADPDDPRLQHGLLIRDDELSIARQPVPCANKDLPKEVLSRLRYTWRGTEFAALLPVGESDEEDEFQLPSASPGMDGILPIEREDSVPDGGPIPLAAEEGVVDDFHHVEEEEPTSVTGLHVRHNMIRALRAVHPPQPCAIT